MPFLQVITRTFGARPGMLARCQASLAGLTDPDYVQTLVVDDVGRGCIWANQNLATVPATGEYVWILDDDDVCCLPNLVEELKALAKAERPELVMMRSQHEVFGLLPRDEFWGRAPVRAQIGYSNFFMRADIWEQHRSVCAEWAEYAGDFFLADYLWRAGVKFRFVDLIAAYYPQQSIGAKERCT